MNTGGESELEGRSIAANMRQHEALNLQFTVSQSIRNTFSVWIIILFVGFEVYPVHGIAIAISWILLVGTVATLRSRLLRPALSLETVLADPTFWARRYAALTALMGGSIAAGPIIFFPAATDLLRMYLTIIFCTWGAGSLASVGGRPQVFVWYLGMFIGAVAFGWLMSDSTFAVQILLLLAVYSAIMFSFAKNFAVQVRQGIDIRLQNNELVARLERARADAEEANLAKSRFLAVASHDLRQPLHALTLMNGMLMRARSPEQAGEITRQISRALSTLERLFNSLLEHSKLEAGSVRAEPVWFSFVHAAERLADEFSSRAHEKGVQIKVYAGGYALLSDPHLFERILRNLIDNALKFTRVGSIEIRSDLTHAGLTVSVADTGSGVPENMREEVFKEYVQGAGAQQQEGLGLGLAIVRRLALLLGFTARLTDTPGGGTTAELCIPLAYVKALDEPAHEETSPQKEISLAGLRVVYIDDDAHARDATALLLKDWGCVGSIGADFIEARSALQDIEPHVVLSDYSLAGGKTGLETIAAFREIYSDVAGAIMTGDMSPATRALLAASEYPVLIKPVNAGELRRLLEVFKSID